MGKKKSNISRNFYEELRLLKETTGRPIMSEAANSCQVSRMGLYKFLKSGKSRIGLKSKVCEFIDKIKSEID